ncbi:hypothetical protein NQ314_014004 [Rhamnusium bicolor]|uniref:Uncharacterized protein n=1 Tax=Rhamnusium bicolor TaxID=1586634 RepID=A0AAV8X670_9CUCU|nr:hypothetical protein NQ314_014004 [Rhamnusium bicolor]
MNHQKKNSQKENGELVRAPRIPNTSLVIDVEHEKNKRKGSNKRKRNVSDVDKNSMIKKMKDNFNRHVSSERPISLDDEMELTDTTSESGSLSNEIIQNLGLSGITVHKVMKNSKRINGQKIELMSMSKSEEDVSDNGQDQLHV